MTRWQDKIPKQYTRPQIKVMLYLQNHKISYVSEVPVELSKARGDGVIMDIYLPETMTRIECDDPYFHRKREGEEDKDRRLEELYGIKTIRLNNKYIMRAGNKYIEENLKSVNPRTSLESPRRFNYHA